MRQLGSKTKMSTKKYRKTHRAKGERIFGHAHSQEENVTLKGKSKGCEEFLKNVGVRSWKSKQVGLCQNAKSEAVHRDRVEESR
jgi:hypothetical protein